jgi:GTP cyclohydrolase I
MQNKHLPDTQNTTDIRNIVINEVGIKDILHPINFINRDQESFSSVATFTMTVRLPENVKGTHMSRFVEILNENECAFSVQTFMNLVQKVADKLNSKSSHIIVDFPFFR